MFSNLFRLFGSSKPAASFAGSPRRLPGIMPRDRTFREPHRSDEATIRREGFDIDKGELEWRDGQWYFPAAAQAKLIEAAVRTTRASLTRELALPTYPGEKLTSSFEIKVAK